VHTPQRQHRVGGLKTLIEPHICPVFFYKTRYRDFFIVVRGMFALQPVNSKNKVTS